eukprot:TRINITY_DN24022_c0_g1_i1.p1 TRINITY_DN24022_c0_g1~~TRINITY_DN24022_c0_g1_i1.p1  ORF type:complete len:365 (-),score=36.15 TRINITY_DN24022_c0_g1_i1:43-1038(-)
MAPRRLAEPISRRRRPWRLALPAASLLLPCGYCRPSNSQGSITLDSSKLMADEVVFQVMFMSSGRDPPFSLFDKSSKDGLIGFEIELLQAVCEAAGLFCPVVTAPSSEAWRENEFGYMGEGLRRMDFDCALGYGNTAARNATLLFGYPYTLQESSVVVTRKIPNPNSKGIGFVRGSVCDGSAANGFPSSSTQSYEDGWGLWSALIKDELSGAIFCGDARAKVFINSSKDEFITTVSTEPVSDGIAFMCHPRKALQVRLLNLGLRLVRVRDSGLFFTSLCKKWAVDCDYVRTGESADTLSDGSLTASFGVRNSVPFDSVKVLVAATAFAWFA